MMMRQLEEKTDWQNTKGGMKCHSNAKCIELLVAKIFYTKIVQSTPKHEDRQSEPPALNNCLSGSLQRVIYNSK